MLDDGSTHHYWKDSQCTCDDPYYPEYYVDREDSPYSRMPPGVWKRVQAVRGDKHGITTMTASYARYLRSLQGYKY